jgi:hypothetical protein
MKKQTLMSIALSAGLLLGPGPRAGSAGQAGDDTDSQIQSLRADLRADKVALINQNMKFTPKESAAFWPIYKKYEYDLSKVNDQRVQLIKDYAQKFDNLTDADAKEMSEKAFRFESDRIDLKKKYFKEFNQELSATTVAKFFQLERRLDLLMDLKLASMLPSLLEKSAA